MDAGRLHRFLVAQGFPVVSVSIPDPLTRATWTVQCPAGTPSGVVDNATATLRSAQEGDITAALGDEDADAAMMQKAIKATVLWTLSRLLGRAPTAQERLTARNEWVAIFKQL